MCVPDWETTKVVIVDPAIWRCYKRADLDLRPCYRALVSVFNDLGVEFVVLHAADKPVDIWIRDWGPIGATYCDYKPSYAPKCYSRSSIPKARRNLSSKLGVTPVPNPLVLDGGNFVQNGRVAVLTEKVFQDKHHLSERQIERMIRQLGVEKVVFIPVEPHDTLGHADGMVRFLSPEIVLVNDYNHPGFRAFGRRLRTILTRKFPSLQLEPFPWFPTNEHHGRIWSAVGTYINFIYTSRGIVWPTFADKQRDQLVAQRLGELTELPLRAVASQTVAALGGVLNCIALTVSSTAE